VSDEPATFDTWYAAEHPRMITSMLALCGNRADAAEVTDEAFARALSHWDRVSVMASPTGWVFRVASNQARRRWRRRSLERRLLPRLATREVVDGPSGEAWLLVRDLLIRQRTAVVLRHVGHLTEAEIGEVMSIGRSTVSSTLRAAYASLGQAIGIEGAEP
jgi:RNA polymerase sigma-70 factor (ECF subfamily)